MSTFFWTPEIDQIVPTTATSFLMHRDDSGLCQAHRVGVPELELIEFIKKHLSGKGVLLDCGAHMGVYSILLSKYFDKVFAFEAQRRTYFQLCGNLFVNEVGNVTPINAGVTDNQNCHQEKTLYVVSEDGGGSTFVKPTDQKILREEKVKMTAIDHTDYGLPVAMIKLDVEGYEYEAMLGGELTIKQYKPLILFESNPGEANTIKRQQIINFLTSMDYKVAQFDKFKNMFIAAVDS